jgi:probable HAF family extracellular repeat protein
MKRRRYTDLLSVILLTMVQCFVFYPSAYSQQSYNIVDLGAMLGSSYSVVNDINNNGDVVGTATIGNSGYAFLYSGGQITLLPTPSGYDGTAGSAINDLGQIGVIVSNIGDQHAFLYSSNNYYLMSTAAAGYISGIDLNNNGQAVWFTTGINNSYIYDHSSRTTTALNTMQAYSINDSGQIAGYVPYASGPDGQTVIFNPDGSQIPLGTLGGNYSQPIQINNSGYVVGLSTVTSGGSSHAFLWTPSEGMKDLNNNSMATYSWAYRVNVRQEVVGGYQATSSSPGRAFIYSNNTMKDLNGMIPSGSGWVLVSAAAINDLGQIAVMGTKNGSTQAFLLNPQYGDMAPPDCDVDGSDLAVLIANPSLMELAIFAQNFGRSACQ